MRTPRPLGLALGLGAVIALAQAGAGDGPGIKTSKSGLCAIAGAFRGSSAPGRLRADATATGFEGAFSITKSFSLSLRVSGADAPEAVEEGATEDLLILPSPAPSDSADLPMGDNCDYMPPWSGV